MTGFEALKKIYGTDKRIVAPEAVSGSIGFSSEHGGELRYWCKYSADSEPVTGCWYSLWYSDDWEVLGEEPKSPALEALDAAEAAIKQAREALK